MSLSHFRDTSEVPVECLTDFLDWEGADAIDWPQACASVVRELCDELKVKPVQTPPEVERASVLTAEDSAAYPEWLAPFRAGQLFANPRAWHEVFARENAQMSVKLQRWVDRQAYGVYIDLDQQGPQPGLNDLSPEEQAFAYKKCVQDWLDSGAISEISRAEVHPRARLCNLIVAYRGRVMERACWSGVSVNEGVEDSSFRMEQLKHALDLVQEGDWAFSLDFQKGFHQVPLDKGTREFLLFRVADRVFRWNVLPMGLKSAPKHFSAVVKQVLKLFRRRGIRCSYFIDDCIFFARSKAEALKLREYVLNTLRELNFRVSLKKSLLNPGQLITHLGFDVCVSERRVYVLPHKVERILALVHETLSRLPKESPVKTTGHDLSVLLGTLRSNALACSYVQSLTVGLAAAMSTLPLRTELGKRRKARKSREPELLQVPEYSANVQFSALAIAELRFWSKCAERICSAPFGRPVQLVVFTDACPKGFGSVLCSVIPRHEASDPRFEVHQLTNGNWLNCCNVHSTAFELLAQLIAVRQYADKLTGRRVHVATDNVGAAYIAGQGTLKNARLHFWALQLAAVCFRHDIQLSTAYLCGDGIIVSGADSLSRGEDIYACALRAEVFERIWAHFGPMDIDAWACSHARQSNPSTGRLLPCISPFDCKERVGFDAMATFDPSVRLYAFPPVPMLGAYIAAVVRYSQPVVLVVPEWPTQAWWSLLNNFAPNSASWLELGLGQDLFVQDRRCPHPFGRGFNAEEAKTHTFWAVSLFWS